MGLNIHREGIPWNVAPRPRRWHRCKPQTTGMVQATIIDRCACGAIRLGGRIWTERNSR